MRDVYNHRAQHIESKKIIKDEHNWQLSHEKKLIHEEIERQNREHEEKMMKDALYRKNH